MCWRHLTKHACGHHQATAADANLDLRARCDAVSAALMFYHDQLHWRPLQQPLDMPRNCPAVLRQDMTTNDRMATVHAHQQDWNAWVVEEFEMNGYGFRERRAFMNKALGWKRSGEELILVPYPVEQQRMYNALLTYQNRELKAPNVTVTGEVPWVCSACRS